MCRVCEPRCHHMVHPARVYICAMVLLGVRGQSGPERSQQACPRRQVAGTLGQVGPHCEMQARAALSAHMWRLRAACVAALLFLAETAQECLHAALQGGTAEAGAGRPPALMLLTCLNVAYMPPG